MTPTKTAVLTLALLAVSICLPSGLAAQDSSLAVTAQKAREAFGGTKTGDAFNSVKLLKEAGLSYQENLLLPLGGALDCKDPRSQISVLSGIYWLDAAYEIAFGKRDRWAETNRYVLAEVNERSAVRDKVKLGSISRSEIWKKLADDPSSEANLQGVFNAVQASTNDRLAQAEKDPEVMAYLIDRYYGAALELTYLGCKLALANPGGDKLIPVYNSMAAQAETLLPVLDSIKDPKLQGDVNQKARMELLAALKSTIRKKAGKLTADDLKAMLKLVEPARSSFAAKCQ